MVLFISMPRRKLQNYLRTYRKRTGLSQADVAYLLGATNAAKVSRYERRTRVPSLETVLAYEVIFGISEQELFGGLFEKVKEKTLKRVRLLGLKIDKANLSRKGSRKQDVLKAITARWEGEFCEKA